MAKITLDSGFVFDVENLYGPGKITERELSEFEPVYAAAHKKVLALHQTGIMEGHLSKDGEPEAVLFPSFRILLRVTSIVRIGYRHWKCWGLPCNIASMLSFSSASADHTWAARFYLTSNAGNFGI